MVNVEQFTEAAASIPIRDFAASLQIPEQLKNVTAQGSHSRSTARNTYETGYHLTEDLIDEGLRFLKGHLASTPEVPWFLMVNPGACHAPHQAPTELIDKYEARFANGWDETRDARLTRQIEMGLLAIFVRDTGWLFFRHLEPKYPDHYNGQIEEGRYDP